MEVTVQDQFLLQQMRWREELEDLQDSADLAGVATFKKRLKAAQDELDEGFSACWDDASRRGRPSAWCVACSSSTSWPTKCAIWKSASTTNPAQPALRLIPRAPWPYRSAEPGQSPQPHQRRLAWVSTWVPPIRWSPPCAAACPRRWPMPKGG